jgi:hypothetical protein
MCFINTCIGALKAHCKTKSTLCRCLKIYKSLLMDIVAKIDTALLPGGCFP